jgi:hypothetical protein
MNEKIALFDPYKNENGITYFKIVPDNTQIMYSFNALTMCYLLHYSY